MSVAVRAEYLDELVTDFKDRDVECSAAKVEDRNLLVPLFLKTIRQRSSCWLINDPRNLQTGDLAGVFCGLSLSIVEVGRDRNDGFVDLVSKVALGGLLQLPQNHRGNLRRSVLLAVYLNLYVVIRAADDFVRDNFFFGRDFIVPPPHESLDGINRVVWIGDRLVFGWLANQRVAFIGKRDDARGEAIAFEIRNDLRVGAFHHGNHRVRRAEVDANDFFTVCHLYFS